MCEVRLKILKVLAKQRRAYGHCPIWRWVEGQSPGQKPQQRYHLPSRPHCWCHCCSVLSWLAAVARWFFPCFWCGCHARLSQSTGLASSRRSFLSKPFSPCHSLWLICQLCCQLFAPLFIWVSFRCIAFTSRYCQGMYCVKMNSYIKYF